MGLGGAEINVNDVGAAAPSDKERAALGESTAPPVRGALIAAGDDYPIFAVAFLSTRMTRIPVWSGQFSPVARSPAHHLSGLFGLTLKGCRVPPNALDLLVCESR